MSLVNLGAKMSQSVLTEKRKAQSSQRAGSLEELPAPFCTRPPKKGPKSNAELLTTGENSL
jgi:hypothetical protein